MSESQSGIADRVHQGAQELGTSVQGHAAEAKNEGQRRLSEQLDRRTTEVGQQTRSLADVLRRSGTEVGTQDNGQQLQSVTSAVADRLERLGGYLEQARGDAMLRDAERFARQRPWLVAGAAAAVGLAASRLLKASSERRYESGGNGFRSGYDRFDEGRDWEPERERRLPGSERGLRADGAIGGEPAFASGGGTARTGAFVGGDPGVNR
jgi:ElaB/YqjD/DUF883 family membrane-anchored ribosome-binding protein